MVELFALLVPVLVVDVLNPVLLGVLVFAAASPRPVGNSLALLAGHTLAYFAVGIVISLGVEQIAEFLADLWNNPTTLSFVLSIVVGLYCFYRAFRPPQESSENTPDWDLTPARCFGFGAVLSVIGAPFAVPYIAAIDQILKADLATRAALGALGAYNIAYALPFLVVPGTVSFMGERARPVLERINDRITAVIAAAMPWLIGLLGAWLVFDGVYFFVVGEPVV